MRFILDCSVTMAWCFEDESSEYTESVLSSLQQGYEARVPAIWKLEVSNVLLITQYKQRITPLIANNFKNALTVLPIHTDYSSSDRAFDTIYELARELHLTAYDAAYVELALREKLPIASLDTALLKAAHKINIQRFELNSR